jgi:hypothetical protein
MPKMPKIMDANHLIKKGTRVEQIYGHPGSGNQKPVSSDQHRVSSIEHQASSIANFRPPLLLHRACPPAGKGVAVGLEI